MPVMPPGSLTRSSTVAMAAATTRSSSHLLHKFDAGRTIFMCCDIQEKLRARIANFHDAVKVSNTMATIYRILTPTYATYVVTEQYPKGVGPTAKDIQLPPNTPVFPKEQPSMLLPEVLPYIFGDAERGILPVQQAVLWGHETHVCIMQTADELLQHNIRVALVVDGCAAQREIDHQTAIQEMATWDGLTLSTTASVLLQLTRGDRALMKSLQHIVKTNQEDASRFPE